MSLNVKLVTVTLKVSFIRTGQIVDTLLAKNMMMKECILYHGIYCTCLRHHFTPRSVGFNFRLQGIILNMIYIPLEQHEPVP